MVLPTIDCDKCTGCGDCVEVCHVNALSLQNLRAAFAVPRLCDYCCDCEAVCPAGAIRCPFEVVFEEVSAQQHWSHTLSGDAV